MKKMLWLVAIGITAVLSSPAQAAVINTYNTQAGWTAASGSPVSVEDFSDNTLVTGLTLNFGTLLPGSISGGALHERVAGSGGGPVFNFAPSIYSFAGEWDLNVAGTGSGLRFLVTFDDNTTQQVAATLNNTGGYQFFGFVSDTAIKSVTLFNNGGVETFDADNVRFAANQVPEPATMAVFGLMAAGGLGYVRRRTKAVAATVA